MIQKNHNRQAFEKMMDEDFYNPYRLFKIPQIGEGKVEGTKAKVVAGLIDASGSMGSFWKYLVKFWNQTIAEHAHFLITFSQNAKLEEHPYLTENLKNHGGGMTNIYAAFKILEERLEEVSKDASITIMFISDGEDTVNGQNKLKKEMSKLKGGQGRDITFLCLGIKSGFPTFVSIKLRQLYHTGDEKIPAVFLIQYASEKAFFNKFQTMSHCFKASNSITAPDAQEYCMEYPWEKPGEVVFQENKWIMVHKEFKVMKIIYNQKFERQYEVHNLDQIPLDDLVDCFRGWVQKVQFLSMNVDKMEETKKIAHQAAVTMRDFTKEYEKMFKLYIITEKPLEIKETFKERAKNLAVKNTGSRIKWYLDELEIIAKGSGIGQLNQYEAAKRIAIGTITGKYHQKALALKGITAKDFQEIKEEFSTVFKKVQLSEKPSKQECSIFTLQNQKQVFEEPDFLDGLTFCKTQFDLVETLPIVGYGLKVKRYDGSMINPWKVRLLSLAKHHKTIDSMYLARNDNKYELNVGDGQTESINAVLPLFEAEDEEMSPILNTRLFKLAVSFMVVQNIDTYHDEAYLALLGTTYVFLLRQPNSQWRNDLIDRIYTSIKITYGTTSEFQEFIASVEENPFNLFKAKQMEDHVDITKVMLIIYYISKEGKLPKPKLDHLVDLALVHYAQKTYVENQFKIFRVADIKFVDQEQIGQGMEYFGNKQMKQFGENNFIKDEKELKLAVDKKLKKITEQNCFHAHLSEKIFKHEDEERRVGYTQIKNFYESLTQTALKKGEILFFFGHYLRGKNPENYQTKVSRDEKKLKENIMGMVQVKDLLVGKGKKMKEIRKNIENQFYSNFKDTHFGIMPITKQKLEQICKQMGLNAKYYDLNPNTGLIRNTCMSPQCDYYMKKMTHLEMHDHLKLWRGQIPNRFHLTVTWKLKNKEHPEKIAEDLIKSGLVNVKRHKKQKQFVIDYVTAIAEKMI